MQKSIYTDTYFADGSHTGLTKDAILYDPNKVAGHQYANVTEPVGPQFQFATDQRDGSPLIDPQYGQTQITPITRDDVEQQQRLNYLANSANLLATISLAESIALKFGFRTVIQTWNEFQIETAGQFASRAEAAEAWTAYKEVNKVFSGTASSMAARSNYLRSLVDDPNTASWMKPWLQKGRVPTGYEVDHIKPLSVGGHDNAANMRLQGADLHSIHHRYYRPWE